MPPLPEQISICTFCSKNVTKKSGGIACILCDTWCHLACADVSNDQIKAIKDNSNLGFVCGSCQEDNDDSTHSPTADKSEISALRNEVKAGFEDMKNNFNEMMMQMSFKITDLKKDIELCNSTNKETTTKVSNLEIDNNILHKRINRNDIIVTGISHSDDLKASFVSLAKFLNVTVSDKDILLCCYIDKKHKVLYKLISSSLKDLIMDNYFKAENLKLSDFATNVNDETININSRVYLNDNHTPMERKLMYFCRNLKKNKQIESFRLLHSDVPRVKIVTMDGSHIKLYHDECFAEFKKKS